MVALAPQARHARRLLEQDLQEAKEVLESSDMERLQLRQELEDQLKATETLQRECQEYSADVAVLKGQLSSVEQSKADEALAAEERMCELQGDFGNALWYGRTICAMLDEILTKDVPQYRT